MNWEEESAALRRDKGLGDYEPPAPFVASRALERSVWYEGQLITEYAQGSVVANSCCVWEGNLPQHVGPPPHIHYYEHELFFVIEGGITAWVEGQPFDIAKDALLFMPAGRIHWFVSTAPETRMLSFTVTAQGDFPRINDNLGLFKFMGVPAEAMTLPPAGAPTPQQLPDFAAIAQLSRDAGSELLDLERLGWRRGFGLDQ